jgi:hypothetical protein
MHVYFYSLQVAGSHVPINRKTNCINTSGIRLLSFGAESVVFQIAFQKLKDQDIQNYNFARAFVWV